MTFSLSDVLTASLPGTQLPSQSIAQTGNEIVEPLQRPITITDLMKMFPPSSYQQGTNTHLYALLTALCGPAGAGGVAMLANAARYATETQLFSTDDLENLAAQFSFRRLPSEISTANSKDYNSAASWRDITIKDIAYHNRLVKFLTGLAYGTSPKGLQLVAEAGCGLEVDIIENYRWLYDLWCDDPLDLNYPGLTASTAEITLVPRTTNEDGTDVTDANGDKVTYSTFISKQTSVSTSVNRSGATKLANIANVAPVVRTPQALAYSATKNSFLLPALQHNTNDLLDQISPQGSFVGFDVDTRRLAPIPVQNTVASSTHFETNRFVTGTPSVTWPTPDPSVGYYVEPAIEKESLTPQAGLQGQSPIWLTIESVTAYTSNALSDAQYGTSAFYSSGSTDLTGQNYSLSWTKNPPPLAKYLSYAIGHVSGRFSQVFPTISKQRHSTALIPQAALAPQDTPILVTS